jgi:hypothetical protein
MKKKEKKISHQIFMDEELGLKKIHYQLITTLAGNAYGPPKSKSGSRNFETAAYPGRTFHAPGRRPWT